MQVTCQLIDMHVSCNNIWHIKAWCSCAPSPPEPISHVLLPHFIPTDSSRFTISPTLDFCSCESLLSTFLFDNSPTDISHKPSLPAFLDDKICQAHALDPQL